MARYSDPLRETGGQLPGDGSHSLVDDVAALMSRQTRPSRAQENARAGEPPFFGEEEREYVSQLARRS